MPAFDTSSSGQSTPVKSLSRRRLGVFVVAAAAATALVSGCTTQTRSVDRGSRAYDAGQYATALDEWQPFADAGDPKAMFLVALLYHDGTGVEQDCRTALRWYRKSAELGYAPAQNNLGMMLHQGEGTERDLDEAEYWYTLASSQGFARAQNNLAVLRVFGQGRDGALNVAAGHSPVGTSDLLKEAAANGDMHSQFLVGSMCYDGVGMPKDATLAATWFHRSAEQGYGPAQTMLGLMHLHGDGVARSSEEAACWLALAAESREHESGSAIAQTNLAMLYLRGDGVAQDEVAAVDLLRRAAAQGNAQAQAQLGMAFESGRGVARDLLQAYAWYALAARSGAGVAIERRSALATKLNAETRFAAEELATRLEAGELGRAGQSSSLVHVADPAD